MFSVFSNLIQKLSYTQALQKGLEEISHFFALGEAYLNLIGCFFLQFFGCWWCHEHGKELILLQIQLDIVMMNLKNGKENKFLLNVVFLVEGIFEI